MKQKQIYFWLFLFTIGILNGQTVHYRYDQTGNRISRALTSGTTATGSMLTHSTQTAPHGCCSSLCDHSGGLQLADPRMMKENYARKTENGEVEFEVTIETVGLLPTGFQPSVHTEAVFPDENLPVMEAVHAPVAVNTAVDTTKMVGEIPILSSVMNGSLFYQVPVEIYPGRDGFQPDISLSYNSMGGNGVAGYGWNIGGLSSIVPVHSNFYYNGKDARPETMGTNADYALDGVSLRRTAAGKYQSEQGHIEATILDSSQKYYFSVVFPDGRQATYGFKNITTPQANYPLTEITDPTGNFIRYKYEQYGNDYYISEITYGCNNTVTGKVNFAYTTRVDVQEYFRAGKKLEQKRLLTNIRVYHKTTLLRTYTLTHIYNSVSLLKKISCKAGARELNPLTFTYEADYTLSGSFTASNATLLTYFKTTGKKILFQRYKENNSKATEGLIAWPDFPTYDVLRYNSKQECEYGSPYPADQEILVYKEIGAGYYSPVPILAKANFAGILAMDYLANGKDAIFTLNYKYNASASQLSITNHSTVSGTPLTITKNLKGYIKEGSYLSPAPRIFLSGDFVGDGKPKLLTVAGHKTPQKTTQSTLDSWLTMIDMASNQTMVDAVVFKFDINEDHLLAIDFNGDGRTDLCHIKSTGTDVYSYIGNQFVKIASTTTLTINDARQAQGKTMVVGDINGDGKMDIMTSPAPNMFTWEKVHYSTCQGGCSGKKISVSADGEIETWEKNGKYCYLYTQEQKVYKPGARTWKVFLSTGTGFDNRTIEFLPRELEDEYLFYDVNGDRLPDLVIKSDNRIQAHLNLGGYLSRAVEASRTVDRKTELLPGIVTTSWSAENRLANLLVINNATVTILKLNKNDGQRRKIASVVNSLGVTQKIYYKSMSDPAVYKTEGTLASTSHYPLILNETLVSSVETWCNNVKTADNAYQYRNSTWHPQGIGFCGFEKITVTDKLRSSNTVYTYIFPKHGVVSQIDSPEQNVKFQYQVYTGSYKILTLNVTKKEETNKLTSVSTYTSYTYDSYDNLTEEKTEYAGTDEYVTNQYTYNYSHSRKELSKHTLIIYQNGHWIEEKEITAVHPVTRQPQTIRQHANGKIVSEKNHTWENGNLMQTREKTFDSPNIHTTTYTRDIYGRVLTVKNPLGLTTTYEYDATTGNMKKCRNYNLKEIIYQYDDFGRVEQISYPDGTIESRQLAWVTSPAGALYKVTQHHTGQPSSVAFFDALNRQVRTGTLRFDNTWVYTDYQYDNRGRLAKESLPFKTSPLSAGINYTYDTYDRITQVSHPAGNTVRRIYDNMKTTTIENGISTIRTIDPTGRLVSVTDPGGTIRYDYMAGGRIYRTFLPNGSVVVTPRDSYGRKQSEYDPGYGRTDLYYDNSGNLARSVDAEKNTTEYKYDAYNRMTAVINPDLTITYEYQDDLLVKKSTNQGTFLEYTYDGLSRLTKIRENGPDGKWLQQELSYQDGNISSIKYTSQSGVITAISNEFAHGYPAEQKLNNQTSIFKLTAENSWGTPTGITTGNIHRTYGYTNYGVMNSRRAQSNSTTLQDFSYDVDAVKGVMNRRLDNSRNKEEKFTHDNMNRLTNFAGNTVTYNTHGNMLSKSNTGDYLYTDNMKPYSVTQLNNVKSAVPVRNQTVEYYSFKRPKSITENGYTASFTYNANLDRNKMHLTKNGSKELTRYYLGDCYEIEEDRVGNIKEKLYIGGNYYSAPAVYVKEHNGNWQLYYICRDHLGSITHLTDSSGSTVTQELSYDAWGNLRNPVNQTNYTPGSEPALFLGRGYTGHEHLPWFGLVNMNARLYDPAIGRFLAPDPYIQMPEYTQSYNRYSYCLNNPLMHVDENGEFVIKPFLRGLGNLIAHWFRGDINKPKDAFKYFAQGYAAGIGLEMLGGSNPGSFISIADNYHATIGGIGMVSGAFNEGMRGVGNAFKMYWGNHYIDENASFLSGIGQGILRGSWEIPQNMVGHTYGQIMNTAGKVSRVDYFGGATFATMENSGKNRGVSLGSYISIQINDKIDRNFDEWVLRTPLYMHEYGHTIDSRRFGMIYLPVIGLTSIISAGKSERIPQSLLKTHDIYWTELRANRHAAKYFRKHFGVNWNFDNYPLSW